MEKEKYLEFPTMEERLNLANCRLSVTSLAEKCFLKRDIYRMDTYHEILSQNLDSDFRNSLERYVSDAKFLKALNKINSAADALKRLLYDPFHGAAGVDGIEKYHYERRNVE